MNPPEKSFDYSSSPIRLMLWGFAPNETFSPLMFMRADTASTRHTNDNGLGR